MFLLITGARTHGEVTSDGMEDEAQADEAIKEIIKLSIEI